MTFARAAGALVAALALAIILSPGAIGLAPEQGPVAGLILLAIGFWATGALPFHLTALALLLLATVLELAPPRVIFAGFASSALWLIFGGLVIGNAVQATGLGRRLARLLVGLLGGSYRRIIYGTVGLGVALAFLVPAAMGRIMILVPIFVALTGELGLARGQPARTGRAARGRLRHHPAGLRDPPGQPPQHGPAWRRRDALRRQPLLRRLAPAAFPGARAAPRAAARRADLPAVPRHGRRAPRGAAGPAAAVERRRDQAAGDPAARARAVGDGFAPRRVARLGRARGGARLHAAGHRRGRRATRSRARRASAPSSMSPACSAWSACSMRAGSPASSAPTR